GPSCDLAKVSTWRVVAASVAGRSHEVSGRPCEDSHAFAVVGDTLVVAVGDGAGSAPEAATGSAVAVTAAVAAMVERLARTGCGGPATLADAVCAALTTSRGALEREAAERAIPLGDLATTLQVAVAGRDGVVAAAVGDGA